MAEAKVSVSRTIIWLTLCSCVALRAASPTRRQFVTITETTSHDPAAVVTNDGATWDDSDDFDLDEDDWLNHARAASPSSFPARQDYDEYDDDDDDYATMRNGKVVVDLGDDEEAVEHQDSEDDVGRQQQDSEFLFLPPRDTRLVLEDDDDPSGPIKVRHTGRNTYPRLVDSDNSVEESEENKEEDSRPFEFTIDDDDDDDKEKDDDDDFVVDESHEKDDSVEVLPSHKIHEDEEDDFESDEEGDEEHMFENPEEDAAQVIYGDHVFLY